MSVRDLFNNKLPVLSLNFESTGSEEFESFDNANQQIIRKNRFVPDVDYSSASNFAYFGLAEEYYRSSFYTILDQYPYDGSSKERTEFLNNSNYLDLYIFENKYPRYNGYANFSSNGWGNLVGTQIFGIGKPDLLEYIYFKGGPNTASYGMEGKLLGNTFQDSNKYQTNIYLSQSVTEGGRKGTRESNLKTNFDNGVTVEFWLKKTGFDISKSETEIIFDLWNGESSSSLNCGRFSVGISEGGATPEECLTLTLQSGSTIKMNTVPGYSSSLWTSGGWHHYAISAYNSGSDLKVDFYLDGGKVYTTPAGFASSFGEITGPLNATIGALQAGLPISSFTGIDGRGYGKLSGSIDEFRFWKSYRSPEQIAKYYWTTVNGGTNTDISNAELGVYYKFNEGITGTSSYDSKVLDYSGRVTNGKWVGYVGSSSRSTGSAMVEAQVAEKEFKDPVIYKEHPQFISILEELLSKGKEHDESSSSALLKTIPSWILDEDIQLEDGTTETKRLFQIIGSMFDSIYMQVKEINKTKEVSYSNTTNLEDQITGNKQSPFNSVLLENMGLDVKELFQDQTFLEYFKNRNFNFEYDLDLTEIKNKIYKNIYNNLLYIYKSKGTEKAFRNMARSLGLNDEILKVQFYYKNGEYTVKDRYRLKNVPKRYINFNNPNNLDSTIYQSASSNVNAQGRNYISGSINKYQSFTSEASVIFPNFGTTLDSDTLLLTSSVFGIHLVSSSGDYQWVSQAQDNNFEVYSVRPSLLSTDSYFVLKDRANNFELTTDIYKDVYSNSVWTFAVRVSNNKYPYSDNSSLISGSSDIVNTIEFIGYNSQGSEIINQFSISSSVSENIITRNKRYYIGANRQNYTGSVSTRSNVKFGGLRHYDNYLKNEAIRNHSIDVYNFGDANPQENEFLFRANNSLTSSYVPKIEMNIMNIDFEMISGSDGNGSFLVQDYSSGSINENTYYPYIGQTLAIQYEFTGFDFNPNDTDLVVKEFVPTSKLEYFTDISSEELVKVVSQDDELFTKFDLVSNILFSVEKNYYSIISSEILQFFGSILSFNELIGDVTLKYRENNNQLEFLRRKIFDHFQDLKDVEDFYYYYKWIDSAVASFIHKLIPESAKTYPEIRNIIEDHILTNGGKYKNIFPYFTDYPQESEIQIGVAKGINEMKKNWRLSTPPLLNNALDTRQNINEDWWDTQAPRKDYGVSTGNGTIDTQRENNRNIVAHNYQKQSVLLKKLDKSRYIVKENNIAEKIYIYDLEEKKAKVIKSGINSESNKNLLVLRAKLSQNSGKILKINLLKSSHVDSLDDVLLKTKIKRIFNVSDYSVNSASSNEEYLLDNIENISSISILSSSVNNGYVSAAGLNIDINNIHVDTLHPDLESSVQTPFSREHVGGFIYRNQGINKEVSSIREEGFGIYKVDSNNIIITNKGVVSSSSGLSVDSARFPYKFSQITRNVGAKRPLNIENIKTFAGTGSIGNYTKESDILLLSGRSTNNRKLVDLEGTIPSANSSSYINQVFDTAKIIRTFDTGTVYEGKTKAVSQHIVVNRFSAPGGPETAGDNNGGYGLDTYSAEYSPYNNVNFRNLSTRIPLNRVFLKDHIEQFSFVSGTYAIAADYSGVPGYHKYHKNPRNIVYQTSSVDFITNLTESRKTYNNAYIGSNLPGTEYQYSWVTGSVLKANSRLMNYQSKDGLASTSVGMLEELVFTTSSQVGFYLDSSFLRYGTKESAGSNAFSPVSYSGLATIINEKVSIGSNGDILLNSPVEDQLIENSFPSLKLTKYINKHFLYLYYEDDITKYPTYVSLPNILNGILSSRNNKYGYPTFKQLRVSDSMSGRFLRNTNRFSYLSDKDAKLVTATLPTTQVPGVSLPVTTDFVSLSGRNIRNTVFRQSPLTNKYYPIEMILREPNQPILNAKAEHLNQFYYLSYKTHNTVVGLQKNTTTTAEFLIRTFTNVSGLNIANLKYSESVWPNEKYRFLKDVRQRIGFDNNFWRDTNENRLLKAISRKPFGSMYLSDGRLGTREAGTGRLNIPLRYARSSWDLDVFPEFETLNFDNYIAPSSLPITPVLFSPPGILQNYTTFNREITVTGIGTIRGSAQKIFVQPTYARPHMEPFLKSVISPFGMDIYLADGRNIKNIPISEIRNSSSFIGSGFAKWEAGDRAEILDRSYDIANQISSLHSYSPYGGLLAEVKYVNHPSKPFYDNYDLFDEDVRVKSKDMSVLPEFRISKHTDDIIGGANPFLDIPDFLSVPQTENTEVSNNSNVEGFYKTFTNSDNLQDFENIRGSTSNNLKPYSIKLKCKAISKFMPYDGFYPSERTVELATKFYEQFAKNYVIKPDTDPNSVSVNNMLRPINQMLFGPGILYNTIKSGIAVDYPRYRERYDTIGRPVSSGSSLMYNFLSESFHEEQRLPFEALYEMYVQGRYSGFDNEPLSSSFIGSEQNRLGGSTDFANDITPQGTTIRRSGGYVVGMNNFLAECENFFLKNREPTKILSEYENNFNNAKTGVPYGMRVKMYRTMNSAHPTSGSWGDYPVPQHTTKEASKRVGYIFVNTLLLRGAYYNNTPYKVDKNLQNLTCSIYLSGGLNTYTLTGTSSISYTSNVLASPTVNIGYSSTTFTIDAETLGSGLAGTYASNVLNFNKYVSDNVTNTMNNIADAINTGTNSEFSASYVGEIIIKNENGQNYLTLAPQGQPGGTEEQYSTTYGMVEVIFNDVSNVYNATMRISNSIGLSSGTLGLQPRDPNGTVDQFFISSEYIPELFNSTIYTNNRTINFPQYSASVNPKETFTMYSRPTAFGPPVAGITSNKESSTRFSGAVDSANGFNMPFTPPYYDGEAWVDIIYVPGGYEKVYTTTSAGFPVISVPYPSTITPTLKTQPASGQATDIFSVINQYNRPLSYVSNPNKLEHGTYIKYWRFDKEAGSNPSNGATGSVARDDELNYTAMHLGASLNLFQTEEDQNGSRWKISTKFETPMLNFNHLTSSNEVFYPTGVMSASVPRGMWHQFGRIPANNQGVYLQVTDIPENWIDNHPSGTIIGYPIIGESDGLGAYNVGNNRVESLADLCGFNKTPVKIGQIAQSVKFREAVIAIPYVENQQNPTSVLKTFFGIDKTLINSIKIAMTTLLNDPALKYEKYYTFDDFVSTIRSKSSTITQTISIAGAITNPVEVILQNLEAVRMFMRPYFYSMPPIFDYYNHENVEPIHIYAFEFEKEFDENDLSYLWQNLTPPSGEIIEEMEVEINHRLLSNSYMGDYTKAIFGDLNPGDAYPVHTGMPSNVKWMVFKVKQRAKKDYGLMSKNQKILTREEDLYGYNWPYDYFSMIERAKVDVEVVFEDKQFVESIETYGSYSPSANPAGTVAPSSPQGSSVIQQPGLPNPPTGFGNPITRNNIPLTESPTPITTVSSPTPALPIVPIEKPVFTGLNPGKNTNPTEYTTKASTFEKKSNSSTLIDQGSNNSLTPGRGFGGGQGI